MTDITRDTTDSGSTGRRTVGTSAAQLSATPAGLARGITIYADAANTASVYVGYSAGVTANAADATDGFPIPPGAAQPFFCDSMSDLWAIASAAGQKYWFLAN